MPNYIQEGRLRDKEETFLKGCLGNKTHSGVAFFGNWLRQVDKILSVSCRVVKQMNECVWDYLEWFFCVYSFCVCVFFGFCLCMCDGVLLMPYRTST